MANISIKARNMSKQSHIDDSVKIGKTAEDLFVELTNSTPTDNLTNIKHADFHYGGKLVDVKGEKESTLAGFVLIEFISVNGALGWIHRKSRATHIAFQIKDQFILVDKDELRKLTLSLCKLQEFDYVDEVEERVYRSNNIVEKFGFENIIYKLWGRKNRQDVITYIKIDDLMKLNYEIV